MKTKEEIMAGLKRIKIFLNARYYKGLYNEIIDEIDIDEDYKVRAKNIDLAEMIYKDDMDTLAEAIKIIESLV